MFFARLLLRLSHGFNDFGGGKLNHHGGLKSWIQSRVSDSKADLATEDHPTE